MESARTLLIAQTLRLLTSARVALCAQVTEQTRVSLPPYSLSVLVVDLEPGAAAARRAASAGAAAAGVQK